MWVCTVILFLIPLTCFCVSFTIVYSLPGLFQVQKAKKKLACLIYFYIILRTLSFKLVMCRRGGRRFISSRIAFIVKQTQFP